MKKICPIQDKSSHFLFILSDFFNFNINFPYNYKIQFFLMDILSIIIIGIGLSMDCFAVSISKGIHAKKLFFWLTLRMALLFGLFQAIMPLIGYELGAGYAVYMKNIDHWVAFGLLSLIGGKMVIEGFKPIDPDSDKVLMLLQQVSYLFPITGLYGKQLRLLA